jgi:succinate dehydrogenase / fumarate reductase, cytochrome b subunit
MTTPSRPFFLNVLQLRMPVGACTSILHRVAGLCLVIVTPFCVYLLDLSLQGPQGFDQVRDLFSRAPVRFVSVLYVWVLAHHVLAGLRHLLTDVDIGSHLKQARRSAWFVNVGSLALALMYAGAWL